MTTHPTIALIDDDCTWLETLAEILRDRGFLVLTAVGGERGLELLSQGGIGLAVIDFHMPDCDGLELLRRLRQRRLDVDVLLMSSDDDPTLPVRALAERLAAFLSKSQAPTALLRTLMATLFAVLAALTRRPPSFSRWDRFLPVPRAQSAWLPALLRPSSAERN